MKKSQLKKIIEEILNEDDKNTYVSMFAKRASGIRALQLLLRANIEQKWWKIMESNKLLNKNADSLLEQMNSIERIARIHGEF